MTYMQIGYNYVLPGIDGPFRIGMTPEQRAHHRLGPDPRVRTGRTLAEVYRIETVGAGNGRFFYRWTEREGDD